MHDRDSLIETIAAAIDSQSAGELHVSWRTHDGQRHVEVSHKAVWDPTEDEASDRSGLFEVSSKPTGLVRVLSRTEENAAAVEMYRRSVAAGVLLSERVLARRFGRSKSWAHDRIQDAKASDWRAS